jgi:hypothetical protein
MARKTVDIKIEDDNRDNGKIYHITEMAASKAELWATRALNAAARSGVEIPDEIRGAGMAGIAVVGIKALLAMNFPDAKELMNEMFECISIKPDPNNPNTVRPLIENDIEEVSTRIRLRAEVFTLHTGFSFAALKSALVSTQPIRAASSNTKTSHRRSAR